MHEKDFLSFGHILVMDRANLAALQRMAPAGGAIPELFLGYAPGAGVDEVPDPYMTGGFDEVLDLIETASAGLLRSLRKSASGAQ